MDLFHGCDTYFGVSISFRVFRFDFPIFLIFFELKKKMLLFLLLSTTIGGFAKSVPSFGPDFEPCVGCENMNGE